MYGLSFRIFLRLHSALTPYRWKITFSARSALLFYGLQQSFTNKPIRSLTLASTYSATILFLAGVAGLEPANTGVKVPCLTDLAIPQYKIGTPERTRTPNPRIRNPMLCPVELLAHMETPIGFEPMILGLQPRALPLGYGIIN